MYQTFFIHYVCTPYPICMCTTALYFKILQVHELWAKRTPETIWRHTSCEVEACIKIALKCVKSDLLMRPTITEIVDKLDFKKIYIGNQLYYRTREFTLNFLRGITNDFSTQNIVGHGGYGIVYKVYIFASSIFSNDTTVDYKNPCVCHI
jgi:hypothetical protein